MLDADHVVGVGVVAQEFDGVTGESRRVAVLSRPAGKEPGPFAVKPPGADAAPLEQQLLRMKVATVRLMIRRIPSLCRGWVE